MRVTRRRFAFLWFTLVTAAIVPFSCVAVKDYNRTTFLRESLNSIAIGTLAEDIEPQLGKPDAIWMQDDGSKIWVYCSSFDWDGVRSRWNDQPFFEYWKTRLNPEKDEWNDRVIEIWVRNGKVVSKENSVSENLIGYYPTLRF